jgi:hypothetical protein
VGISATGDLNAGTLAEVLRALPKKGAWELCCHPGYNDAELDGVKTRLRREREVEREALLAEVAKALASADGLEVIHYGKL